MSKRNDAKECLAYLEAGAGRDDQMKLYALKKIQAYASYLSGEEALAASRQLQRLIAREQKATDPKARLRDEAWMALGALMEAHSFLSVHRGDEENSNLLRLAHGEVTLGACGRKEDAAAWQSMNVAAVVGAARPVAFTRRGIFWNDLMTTLTEGPVWVRGRAAAVFISLFEGANPAFLDEIPTGRRDDFLCDLMHAARARGEEGAQASLVLEQVVAHNGSCAFRALDGVVGMALEKADLDAHDPEELQRALSLLRAFPSGYHGEIVSKLAARMESAASIPFDFDKTTQEATTVLVAYLSQSKFFTKSDSDRLFALVDNKDLPSAQRVRIVEQLALQASNAEVFTRDDLDGLRQKASATSSAFLRQHVLERLADLAVRAPAMREAALKGLSCFLSEGRPLAKESAGRVMTTLFKNAAFEFGETQQKSICFFARRMMQDLCAPADRSALLWDACGKLWDLAQHAPAPKAKQSALETITSLVRDAAVFKDKRRFAWRTRGTYLVEQMVSALEGAPLFKEEVCREALGQTLCHLSAAAPALFSDRARAIMKANAEAPGEGTSRDQSIEIAFNLNVPLALSDKTGNETMAALLARTSPWARVCRKMGHALGALRS